MMSNPLDSVPTVYVSREDLGSEDLAMWISIYKAVIAEAIKEVCLSGDPEGWLTKLILQVTGADTRYGVVIS